MSTQERSRRKRTFKLNTHGKERTELLTSSNFIANTSTIPTPSPAINVKQEETSLNVRRSSRKPKPIRHDDEEEYFVEYTTTEPVAVVQENEELRESHGENTSTRVRRETRNTFHSYLETLGYNADFSKIPSKIKQGQLQLEKDQIDSSQKSKCSKSLTPKQMLLRGVKDESISIEKKISSKLRVSLRTPRPKKMFSLLDANMVAEPEVNFKPAVEKSTGFQTAGKRIEDVVAKILKQKKESSKLHEQKSKGRKNETSVAEQTFSSTIPLSKQDVDQTSLSSPNEDTSQARVSKRARVPKRRFSLIEDSPEPDDAKRQRVMSPEQEKEEGQIIVKQEKCEIEKNDIQEQPNQSKLVIKRSDTKRKRVNQNKEDQLGDQQKREKNEKSVDRKNQFEIGKKAATGKYAKGKKPNPTAHPLLAENANDEKKIEKNKSKECIKQNRKNRKVKKSKSDLNANESVSEEGDKEKPGDGEHIVLKLSIPHDSGKHEEKDMKHYHKHHHHKHKKEKRQNGEGTKKNLEIHVESNDAETEGSATLADGENKTKKRKRIKPQKVETSESLSSDNSAVPHVKLLIKKSPLKSKGVKITSEVITSVPEGDDSHGQGNKSDTEKPQKKKCKPKLVNEITKRKEKPPLKNQKKKIGKKEKEMKLKTVSAYSLFTKSKRKALAKMEPDLDFADISRRLAGMWKDLSLADREFWRGKAMSIRRPFKSTKGRQDWLCTSSKETESTSANSGTGALDMAAYLKLLGESLCSIGMCLKRQDQMEVHGSLSVLLDTALCSIVPLFCLTSQLPEMNGCTSEVQAQILDNLAYIIPGL